MRVFLFFARAYPRQSLLVVLCLLVAGAAGGVGLAAVLPVLGLALDPSAGTASGFRGQLVGTLRAVGFPLALAPLSAVVFVSFLLKAALIVLAKREVGYAVARAATDLRLRLLRSLLAARWAYTAREPIGLATNAIATEAQRAGNAYYHLAMILSYGAEFAVAAGVGLAISWQVTLGGGLGGIIGLGLLGGLVRKAKRAGRRQTEVTRSLMARLTDVLQAARLLKVTGREPLVGPFLEDDTRRLRDALRRLVVSREALRAAQEPILVGLVLVGMIVCIEVLALPVTEVLVLAFLFERITNAVNKMQRKYQEMVSCESALWSLVARIDAAEAAREENPGTRAPRLERGIELHEVHLAYDRNQVARGLSLAIPARRITALVGESGAGKTTLVDLVTGLVRPDAGEVTVDGTPLDQLDLQRWRRMIGYVPQDAQLFNDSVRRNVTLGDPELDEADVVRALREAGAWEAIAALPEGIDAPVGERGALLSGGQLQRVAIARALVHRPALLILDEATASLDPETEARVLATVAGLRGRTTVLAISHQPALQGIADVVYRLAEGRAHTPAQPPAALAEGMA